MDLFGQTLTLQLIQFFILYGVTGVVLLIAALYLLLRRSNAFAPGVTPPLRLRRWAASLFFVAALGHVWWYLFYAYSRDLDSMDGTTPSVGYVVVVVFDCVTLLTTIAGTLLSMLQDRRRRSSCILPNSCCSSCCCGAWRRCRSWTAYRCLRYCCSQIACQRKKRTAHRLQKPAKHRTPRPRRSSRRQVPLISTSPTSKNCWPSTARAHSSTCSTT